MLSANGLTLTDKGSPTAQPAHPQWQSRTTRIAGGLRKAPKRGYLVKQVLLAIEVFLILHVSTDHLLV
jgi:hypothetical protein